MSKALLIALAALAALAFSDQVTRLVSHSLTTVKAQLEQVTETKPCASPRCYAGKETK